MHFMFRKRRKRKSKQVTLKDLKKDFDKNGEYRYVIVTMDTKKPYAIDKTYKDAIETAKCGCKYDYYYRPLYVVDLLYWKG